MFNRREWLAAWAAIAAAAQTASPQGKLEFFTPAEARELDAMIAQIIPSDESPGAREAGVIRFIDRAMQSLDNDVRQLYRQGLADLGPFSTLDASAQRARLESIQQAEFFRTVRMHTVMGFLADPKYGGNRDKIGWKLMGFNDSHVHRAPFGFYDAVKP